MALPICNMEADYSYIPQANALDMLAASLVRMLRGYKKLRFNLNAGKKELTPSRHCSAQRACLPVTVAMLQAHATCAVKL
jgi:hypothetical protein